MSSLYRLKAYFGMVPPEDMDAYADAYGYGGEYDQYDYDEPERAAHSTQREHSRSHSTPVEQVPDQRQAHDGAQRMRPEARTSAESTRIGGSGSGSGSTRSGHRTPTVHGSLAVDTDSAPISAPIFSAPPMQEPPAAMAAPLGSGSLPLSRITTVHPRSYNEARTIGERYREGIPVIINLTELDDAAAKRLVDFAAGLAFALRGSIDKITSRVFLLSPAGVDVSAEERRKLAERGYLSQD
jgi:cell division inhibitor SepF